MYHIKCQQYCRMARSLFLSLFVYMHLCLYHDSTYFSMFHSTIKKLKKLFLWVGCCHFSVTLALPLNTLTHKVVCTQVIQQILTKIQ